MGIQFHKVEDDNKPAIILDESCLNQKDYPTAVMGKVKEFSSLTNLKIVLANEENKFNTNVGTRSWFSRLQQASSTFHIDERVTWVDIEGKVFCIRAKEVSSWVPDFVEDEEEDSDSEDGSIEEGPYSENVDKQEEVNSEEGDVEEVSKTIFEKEQDQVPKEDNFNIGENGLPSWIHTHDNADSQSSDLKGVGKEGVETLKNDQEEKQNSEVRKPSSINNSKKDREESICSGHFQKNDKPHSGGSMLPFMEDLVKVGQAMGYNLEGCLKNIEEIIGYSGGILCVWNPRLFLNVNSTISDYFVMIKGELISNDDAVFMGQWSDSNIETIVHVLECFHRASGLRINMNKSKIMRISVAKSIVEQAATKIGYAILTVPFSYLGLKVGDLMSLSRAWNDIVNKLTARLSKWKMKTLSIGDD
ncbi:hypothetical protein Tco_0557028 [Tanacetum coccineum]